MKIYKKTWDEVGVRAEISSFSPKKGGVTEYHAMLHLDKRHIENNDTRYSGSTSCSANTFVDQLERLYMAEELLRSLPELADAKVILKRYFLSDSTNQEPLMRQHKGNATTQDDSCAVSYIQQPPLDGSKVALWVYLQRGAKVYASNGMTITEHNGYKHLWRMGMHEDNGDSAKQTERLLIDYETALKDFGATLKDNCIRTWFFVRDVDTQYAGMVKARRENFIEQGLTPDTHYISSTGIGGSPANTKALVQLGTYALTGFEPSQQRYLYALSHLNRTIEYGVTFERGTLIEYGDRAHAYISGTASIDNKGNVVHVGDIVGQTYRMWENVEALLAEGDMTFGDIMHIIVYLRDIADYDVVKYMFEQKFPNIPFVITLAPVCRPTWLIEMECVAVKERQTEYRDF